MRKKLFVVFAALLCYVSLMGATFVSAAETSSTALFLESVRMDKEEDGYVFTYRFDKSVASEEKDITLTSASKFTVNQKGLNEVEGAKVAYAEQEGVYVVQARVPAASGCVKEDGTDRVNVLAGFECDTGYRTTVRYIYQFAKTGEGERIYRSDNIDDYAEVSVTSVSVPEVQSSNFVFYIYLSEVITPRKYIDLQVRSLREMLFYHGEKGDKQYSDSELTLLYDYQIFSRDWADSISYKFHFGCDSYNGLQAFPGNNGGYPYDMTPQEKINGTDLYNVYQIQEQVADTSLVYLDKNGQEQSNGGSLQPLAIQIHMDNNRIQVVLKGDSLRDDLATKIVDAAGQDTGMTSFNENIAPNRRENMALCLKSGLLFPNGKILKEDFSFYYDPVGKQWRATGTDAGETVVDETLSNQEGYTDEELAAKNDGNGGTDESGGCKSIVNVGNPAAAATSVTLFAAAAIALFGRRNAKNR